MKHIVFFSSGAASYAAARLIVNKHRKENVLLVFADTGIEDEDNYRFLKEGAKKLGAELIWLKPTSKTPWDIYDEKRFLNHRVSFCSIELKIKPCKDYIANYSPNDCILYFGIDFNEIERAEAINKNWQPYRVIYPLCEDKWLTRIDIFKTVSDDGIALPRLYSLGFSHANCGGFCVKAGKKQFKLLLEHFRDRYIEHEKREKALCESIGKKDGVILRDSKRGTISLEQFRLEIESAPKQLDLFSESLGGCGCFLDDY